MSSNVAERLEGSEKPRGSILIGGDTLLKRGLHYGLGGVPSDGFVGPLRDIVAAHEHFILNHEGPASKSGQAVIKAGPHAAAELESLEALKRMGATLLGLANNHAMDYGWESLSQTIKAANELGLAAVGAGAGEEEAAAPAIIECGGVTVAVLAMADNEFGVAQDGPGVASGDPLSALRSVRGAKSKADRILVLMHGGNEQCEYPSPQLQSLCRAMAEEGASLIVCQHSHVVGCAEEWQGGSIVYGQGNFLFSVESAAAGWNDGMLLSWRPGEVGMPGLIFFSRSSEGLKVLSGKDREQAWEEFRQRSETASDRKASAKAYAAVMSARLNGYLDAISGAPRVQRALFRVFPQLRQWRDRPERLRLIGNLFRCQAHRDALVTLLCDSERPK